MGTVYNTNVVTDGLVTCWDASNRKSYPGAGTTWTDLAGNGDGTLINSPTFDPDNMGSVDFDGTNDYVELGTPSSLTSLFGLYGVTVEAWLRIDSTISAQKIIFDSGANERINLDITADGLAFMVGARTGRNAIVSGSWYHFCGVYDGANVISYLNGAWTSQSAQTGDISTDSQTFNIGRFPYYGGYYFPGKIASIKVYRRGLSAEEVLQNYNATKRRFIGTESDSLVLDMDAGDKRSYPGAGTVWTDIKRGAVGTLTNGPSLASDGMSIDFDGSDDYVSVPDSSDLRIGLGQFTISMWVFDENDDSSYFVWMAKGQTGADEWSLYHSTTNRLRFYADSGGIDMSYTGAMASAWHHVVVTRDSTQANLYRDGASVATDTSDVYDLNTTKDISIGASEEGSARFTTGKIATVQLYDRALTAAEILDDYNKTKGRFA